MNELPRGMKDYSIEETSKLERIRETFKDTCKSYKFNLIETSPIEFLKTMEKKAGEEIDRTVYTWKDKKNRDLALRFDLTLGIVRQVAHDRSLKMPYRVATFGSVFRYDEPQRLRWRHFHQANIEIFSTEDDSDINETIIDFTKVLFTKLGIFITFDFKKERGLNYYDDYTFEVFTKDEPLALAGGGRYNKLMKTFGRSDLKAIGMAIGVERVMAFM